MKNVLMLTYAFFPVFHGGVPRVAKFCKYLSEYGWNPVLVAADMRGDTVHARTSEKDPCEAFRVKNPGRLKRPRTALGRKLRFLRRNIEDIPMDGLEEAMYRQAAQLLRERPFDAIFASSLPQFIHRIARRLSRESGIPWVADHRDIIGQDGGFGFYKSLSLLHRLIYPLEFLTTVARDTRYDRHASAIVTVSEGLAGRLRRRTLRRVDVVMNGFDEEDYRDILLDKKEFAERFRLLFVACGTRENFYQVTKENAEKVLEAGVPIETFWDYGYHDWTFWRHCANRFLRLLF